MSAPPAPEAPFTIPPPVLRTMLRAYVSLITLLYTAFGINFLALPLSVAQYGGVFANKWLWGPLFLLAALALSHALADRAMGRLLTTALLISIAVSGMWLFAAAATTLIGHINYVSPFVWLLIVGTNVCAFMAQAYANPHVPLPHVPWVAAGRRRLSTWFARRRG